MRFFFENPLPILAVGGTAATVALAVFLGRRTLGPLVALISIIVGTGLLVTVERIIKTDREQVEEALSTVLLAIENNSLVDLLAQIDPAAQRVRSDAHRLAPIINVEKARSIGALEVTVETQASPPKAKSVFRAYLDGVHAKTGTRIGYFNQQVDLEWRKRGERWLVVDYKAYYDGQPIDAVSSASGNRPVQ